MASVGECPQCGTALFESAAAGLCPRCLGSLGFAAGPEAEIVPLRRDRLGDYELIEEIARGGMGIIFKARQTSLNRRVAVKVILHGPFSSPEFVRRFQTEATAAARLQHPNIVPIYEVGREGDRHYFSMEYIEGQNLATVVQEKPLAPRRAARYLQSIAEAVQYAHEHDIVHRDLKPSNVLLDSFDQPRVTDFGLAKLLNSEGDLTLTGQVLGSPSHISPEQAAGMAGTTSPAADIYSLGAILYHLVTGRPPFQGETIQEILWQVHNSEPIPPRRLNPSVPIDLQNICLKCLQKEASRRYTSAAELAQDLIRFQANEPIQARPVSVAERAWLWCKRRPVLATLGIALIAAVGLIVVGVVWELNRANERVRVETELRKRAEHAEAEREHQLYGALLAQAKATVRSGELGQRTEALAALKQAAAISNSAALRGVALTAFTLPDLNFERSLPCGSDQFTLVRLDPQFTRIAVARGTGPVELRSVSNYALLNTLPATTNWPAHNARWSGDGRFLAVKRDRDFRGIEAQWEVWEASTGRTILQLGDVFWNAAGFHPKRAELVVGLKSGEIVSWDLTTGKERARIAGQLEPSRILLSPDGARVAVVQDVPRSWKISVLELSSGSTLMSHDVPEPIMNLDWHCDGRWIAIADYGMSVSLIDSVTGEMRLLGTHKATASDVSFVAGGRYLFSTGWEREFICWDMNTLQPAFAIGLNSDYLQLRADGEAGAVQTPTALQLYKFERPSAHREFAEDLGGRITKAAFSPDGRWVAAVGAERIGVWDLFSAAPGALTNGIEGMRLSFSADGELFADSRLRCARFRIHAGINGAAPQLEELPLQVPPGTVSLSVFSNQLVLSGTAGSKVTSLAAAADPNGYSPTADGLSGLSADGRFIAMHPPFGAQLFVYRFPSLEPVTRLKAPYSIVDFQFAPGGDELAVASRMGVEFWNTTKWRRTRVETNFSYVLYGPDSKSVWFSRDYRGAGLYDSRTFELLLPLPGHGLPMAVSPDGRQLAVSLDARKVQVWDLVQLRQSLHELGLDWPEPGLKSR